jgi:hypothetical protein
MLRGAFPLVPVVLLAGSLAAQQQGSFMPPGLLLGLCDAELADLNAQN